MDDLILFCVIIMFFVSIFSIIYSNNYVPFSATVVDKFITSSRTGYPCYYIVIQTDEGFINRKVTCDDYYNGYFVGYSYDF